MKFIKFSLWMSLFGFMVVFGLNFSKPGSVLSRHLPSRPEAQKRWVLIEGKSYEYNPKNVYNVNGVPTYYKPSKTGDQRTNTQEPTRVPPSATPNLQRVQKMAEQGALSAYTPGGMQTIMDAAKEAKIKADERSRALHQLMNE